MFSIYFHLTVCFLLLTYVRIQFVQCISSRHQFSTIKSVIQWNRHTRTLASHWFNISEPPLRFGFTTSLFRVLWAKCVFNLLWFFVVQDDEKITTTTTVQFTFMWSTQRSTANRPTNQPTTKCCSVHTVILILMLTDEMAFVSLVLDLLLLLLRTDDDNTLLI